MAGVTTTYRLAGEAAGVTFNGVSLVSSCSSPAGYLSRLLFIPLPTLVELVWLVGVGKVHDDA